VITACEDLAGAVAAKSVECAELKNGVDLPQDEYQVAYQASYDSFVQTAAEGSCGNIKTVRDSASLYDNCLPAVQTLPCDDVLAGNLPAACQKQLIR
jgi:hypothetical protein